MASTGLPAAVETIFNAADPALACDLAGLDFSALADEDRKLLTQAHRQAIGEGIALIGRAAAGGDQRARRWLDGYGLPMGRRNRAT